MMRSCLAIAISVAALSCSPSRGPEVGGETHWLALCKHDSDCGEEGLQCICGTCTKPCEGDDACRGEQCYDSQSPLLLDRCDNWDSEAVPAICLAQCEGDAACKRGQRCLQGACVAEDAVEISDFASVSDEVSWSEPVAIVPPSDTIEDVPTAMLGTWRELDCDSLKEGGHDYGGCFSLTLERDPTGLSRGTVKIVARAGGDRVFAPVSDADRGYPLELDPMQYASTAMGLLPEVDYRVLDAEVFGDRLVFQWNLRDLWHPWCQLQQPHRWESGGRAYYFCVPQDPVQQAAMDPGKVFLCKDPAVARTCTGSGSERSCVCDEPSTDLPCGLEMCACDSQRCDVRARMLLSQVQFARDGQTAELSVVTDGYMLNATLHRSSQ
jgi:hypothetical protein